MGWWGEVKYLSFSASRGPLRSSNNTTPVLKGSGEEREIRIRIKEKREKQMNEERREERKKEMINYLQTSEGKP